MPLSQMSTSDKLRLKVCFGNGEYQAKKERDLVISASFKSVHLCW